MLSPFWIAIWNSWKLKFFALCRIWISVLTCYAHSWKIWNHLLMTSLELPNRHKWQTVANASYLLFRYIQAFRTFEITKHFEWLDYRLQWGSENRTCLVFEWCSDFKWLAIFRQNGSHFVNYHSKTGLKCLNFDRSNHLNNGRPKRPGCASYRFLAVGIQIVTVFKYYLDSTALCTDYFKQFWNHFNLLTTTGVLKMLTRTKLSHWCKLRRIGVPTWGRGSPSRQLSKLWNLTYKIISQFFSLLKV